MRKLLIAALTLLLAAPALTSTVKAATIIYPRQARSYVGRSVTVRGNVEEVHQGRKVTYVYLGGRGRDAGVVLAVYPAAVDVFDDSMTLPGKMVEVSGRIQLVKGIPLIAVNTPRQMYAKD